MSSNTKNGSVTRAVRSVSCGHFTRQSVWSAQIVDKEDEMTTLKTTRLKSRTKPERELKAAEKLFAEADQARDIANLLKSTGAATLGELIARGNTGKTKRRK
jgi:hypothetical protein